MPIIPTSPIVTVRLSDDIADGREAFVRSWRVGKGSKPTMATIALPDTPAQDTSWSDGKSVEIWQDSACVFRGHVYTVPQSLDGTENEVELVCYDVRQAMTRRTIGQSGVGPVATYGGWPGFGLDITFNRDGKPNRSTDPVTGLHTLSNKPTAGYWTYAQILQFIYYWYVDTYLVTVDMGKLSGPLGQVAPQIVTTLHNPATLTDQIMRTLGGTWTIANTGGPDETTASVLQPILAGIAAETTRAIWVNTRDSITTPGRYHASKLKVERSTLNSYDRVEIQSAPYLVETTYSNLGLSPLFEAPVTSADDLPAGEVAYFAVDVTQYFANGLGAALPAGARPKRWDSKLVTRRDDTGYMEPLASMATGERVPCKECIWLSVDTGTTWKRVKGGVRIDYENSRLYISKQVSLHGRNDSSSVSRRITTTQLAELAVRFTVATIVPDVIEYVQGSSATYLDQSKTKVIVRKDLVPMARRSTRLPLLGAGVDPNESTVESTLGVETYHDVYETLVPMAQEIWRSRQEAEVTAKFTLPFMPQLDIGEAITFYPESLGLGTLRVTDIAADGVSKALSVSATNNLDFSK